MSGSRLNHELGDTHLSPEEAVLREREELLQLASKSKIWGQEELENSDRSAGPRLYYTEIVRRLQVINPRLAVRDGLEGSVALYRPVEPWEYDPEQWDPERPDWFNQHKYVGGMKKDWLPEFSHVLLDTSNLPTREVRGWRSVLLSLIKSHTISIKSAIQQFGDPSTDQRSGRWNEQIWEFCNKSKQENENA